VRQRKEVLAALALQPGEKVLDVGSGPGLLMADMADLVGPEGHVIGIDVSDSMYEYVPDVDRALAELHRVLRPGGRALILDTDWDSLVWNTLDPSLRDRFIDAWTKRFAHPHLPRTLQHRLRNAGFRVLRCDVLVLLNDTYDPTRTV
jgi:ubiquinone/menaquinone biosynthesis C-methylase UbiE